MAAGLRRLGKLVLVAGAVVLLTAATACTSDPSQEPVQRLEDQLADLEQRLTEAQLQPAAAPQDGDRGLEARLRDLSGEIAALEAQLGVIQVMIEEASPAADSTGLPERLFALEQKLEALGHGGTWSHSRSRDDDTFHHALCHRYGGANTHCRGG